VKLTLIPKYKTFSKKIFFTLLEKCDYLKKLEAQLLLSIELALRRTLVQLKVIRLTILNKVYN